MKLKTKEDVTLALAAVYILNAWEHAKKNEELSTKVERFFEYQSARFLTRALQRTMPKIFADFFKNPPSEPSKGERRLYLSQFDAIWRGKNGNIPCEVLEVQMAAKSLIRIFEI